jgi:hypothetical protein
MIDGQHGDTGDATLEAAGAAIESLLSGEPEDKKTREAPRKSEERTATEVETETAETTDESEEEQLTPEGESDEIEEEPEPTEPEPRKLRVKVDGEELELPEDEVVKGYSRTADYTRKTQKLPRSESLRGRTGCGARGTPALRNTTQTTRRSAHAVRRPNRIGTPSVKETPPYSPQRTPRGSSTEAIEPRSRRACEATQKVRPTIDEASSRIWSRKAEKLVKRFPRGAIPRSRRPSEKADRGVRAVVGITRTTI